MEDGIEYQARYRHQQELCKLALLHMLLWQPYSLL